MALLQICPTMLHTSDAAPYMPEIVAKVRNMRHCHRSAMLVVPLHVEFLSKSSAHVALLQIYSTLLRTADVDVAKVKDMRLLQIRGALLQ